LRKGPCDPALAFVIPLLPYTSRRSSRESDLAPRTSTSFRKKATNRMRFLRVTKSSFAALKKSSGAFAR